MAGVRLPAIVVTVVALAVGVGALSESKMDAEMGVEGKYCKTNKGCNSPYGICAAGEVEGKKVCYCQEPWTGYHCKARTTTSAYAAMMQQGGAVVFCVVALVSGLGLGLAARCACMKKSVNDGSLHVRHLAGIMGAGASGPLGGILVRPKKKKTASGGRKGRSGARGNRSKRRDRSRGRDTDRPVRTNPITG